MEGIIDPIVDLFKTYVYQGGVSGIVISAFALIVLALIVYNRKSNLGIILLFVLCILVLLGSVYSTANWKQISGSRLSDKHWAVQLETDDTIEDALKNKERFEPYFKDLAIMLARDAETGKARFYLFNLYATKMDADNGAETAHREWQALKYPKEYQDSASTEDLNQQCKNIEASEDGRYFICNNE